MKFIGLLMVAEENDILERTLAYNAQFLDCFYALDGGDDFEAVRICQSFPNCAGVVKDAVARMFEDLPDRPVDGYRKVIHELAVRDHGPHNWFVLLHGDEVWTRDPRELVDGIHDGFVFPLPFFFPREGEPWHDDVHPLDQLTWHLAPGYPEFRMFLGGPNVAYNKTQHFNVRPQGLGKVGACNAPILHYPYRSPEVQRARAARHQQTGFDPDNYRHILNGDNVYWTDDMIAEQQTKPWFAELRSTQAVAA